jgi:hypothetical protein
VPCSPAVAEFTQILVSGGSAGGLAGLAAAHPGWHVASRGVANAAAAQAAAQNGFANNLILGLVAALTAVALLNTLARPGGGRPGRGGHHDPVLCDVPPRADPCCRLKQRWSGLAAEVLEDG